MAEIRNARSSVRVAFQGATTAARVAQTAARALIQPASTARVAQAHLRVLSTFIPVAQIAQMSLRVLVSGPFGLGNLMWWDGASWQPATAAKMWDGAGWVDGTAVKAWTGTAWVP